MRIVHLLTQSGEEPVDHTVDVAIEMSRIGHRCHIIGPPGDYVYRLSGSGVKHHQMDIGADPAVAGMKTLAAVIRSIAPDIMHCQDRRASLVGRLLTRELAIASIYTLHAIPETRASDASDDRTDSQPEAGTHRSKSAHCDEARQLWMAHSMIIVPCHALETYAVEYLGIPAGHVATVHNGIATAAIPQADTRSASVRAVWLGTMKPVKRVPDLVHAVSLVPDLDLLLVGDGPERPSIERAITQHGINYRTTLTGYKANPYPLLAAAGIFAMTSGFEASPLALLQAMACGLPVVATRAGGIPEIVRDGIDGLLVEPGDVHGLADVLRQLCHDPDLRVRLAEQALARVQRDFTITQCAVNLIDIYKQVAR